MKHLINIASNMTEVKTNNGEYVLFSYSTPVAGYDDKGAFKTDVWYSRTTTRHINKYLDGVVARVVEQEYIDSLI